MYSKFDPINLAGSIDLGSPNVYPRCEGPPANRPASTAGSRSVAGDPLVEEAAGRELYCRGQFFYRRDLRVAFAALNPADLAGLNTAARRQLFLSELEVLAGRPQVGAKVAHAVDRPLCGAWTPCEILHLGEMSSMGWPL